MSLSLVNSWDDPVWHDGAVLFPVLPILGLAFMFIPSFPVKEENGKIYWIEVRDETGESWKRFNG